MLKGNSLFMAEKFDAAIAQYNLALQSDPANVAALKGLAACYEETGDVGKSLAYSKQADAAEHPAKAVASPTAAPSAPTDALAAGAEKDAVAQTKTSDETEEQIEESREAFLRKLDELKDRRRTQLMEERLEARRKDSVGYELSGGYTWVGLGGLAAQLDRLDSDTTLLHQAGYGGLDINVDCLQGSLAVGPRVRLIGISDVALSEPNGITDTWGYNVLPVMLGVQYRAPFFPQLQLSFNAGYAWAWADEEMQQGSLRGGVDVSGGAPVVEAGLGLRLSRRSFHVGLDLDARELYVTQMQIYGVNGAAVGYHGNYSDPAGHSLAFDFSGFSAGLKLSEDF